MKKMIVFFLSLFVFVACQSKTESVAINDDQVALDEGVSEIFVDSVANNIFIPQEFTLSEMKKDINLRSFYLKMKLSGIQKTVLFATDASYVPADTGDIQFVVLSVVEADLVYESLANITAQNAEVKVIDNKIIKIADSTTQKILWGMVAKT